MPRPSLFLIPITWNNTSVFLVKTAWTSRDLKLIHASRHSDSRKIGPWTIRNRLYHSFAIWAPVNLFHLSLNLNHSVCNCCLKSPYLPSWILLPISPLEFAKSHSRNLSLVAEQWGFPAAFYKYDGTKVEKPGHCCQTASTSLGFPGTRHCPLMKCTHHQSEHRHLTVRPCNLPICHTLAEQGSIPRRMPMSLDKYCEFVFMRDQWKWTVA